MVLFPIWQFCFINKLYNSTEEERGEYDENYEQAYQAIEVEDNVTKTITDEEGKEIVLEIDNKRDMWQPTIFLMRRLIFVLTVYFLGD
jgi:hypothetical protein